MWKKALKIGGFLVLFLLLAGGGLFYTQIYNYERFPLKADRTRFPNVNTEAEIEHLAEELLSQMTLDERIEQLFLHFEKLTALQGHRRKTGQGFQEGQMVPSPPHGHMFPRKQQAQSTDRGFLTVIQG